MKRGGRRSLHRDEGRVVTSLLPSASSPAAASARHQRIRRGRAQRACCPGVGLVKSSPRTGPSPAIWWASCKMRLCQLRSSSSQLSHKDLRDASGEPESVSSTGVSPDNDCGQRSSSASLLPQVLLPQAVRRAPDSCGCAHRWTCSHAEESVQGMLQIQCCSKNRDKKLRTF